MSSRATVCVRVFTHPMLIGLATIASVILWMPFGMGYYGWPWESASMRLLLGCFVNAFPVLAVVGFIRALSPELSVLRALVAILALVVGLFGIFAMSSWRSTYVQPMLQRASTSSYILLFHFSPESNRTPNHVLQRMAQRVTVAAFSGLGFFTLSHLSS